MRRNCVFIIIAGLAAAAAAQAGEPASDAPRSPLPDAEARETAEAAVRNAFGEALDADADDQRIVAARRLIQTAQTTADPASKLVMYEHAASLAALAGKPKLVADAVDPVVARFRVDPLDYRHEALTAAQRWARSPEDAAYLAQALLELHRLAIVADRFERALRLARQAQSPARLARSTHLRRAARMAEIDARRLHNAYRQIESSLQRLAEAPDDPKANEAVGRFYAFAAGQVRRGAKYLARGADETLAALAERELQAPDDPSAQAKLADRWWQWAHPRRGDDQATGLRRAVHWYEQAIDRLEGLAKLTAEKRIADYYQRYADVKGAVVAGDVALAERGATAQAPSNPDQLIDGNSTQYDGSSGFASGRFPCAFTVDLGKLYRLRRVRILLWDGNDRHYKYTASVSVDGRNWTTIADHADKPSQSWQTLDFPARPVRHIRVRGLHNTDNAGFHIVEIQAHCRPR